MECYRRANATPLAFVRSLEVKAYTARRAFVPAAHFPYGRSCRGRKKHRPRQSLAQPSASVQQVQKGLADIAVILTAPDVPHCFDIEGLKSRAIGKDRLVAVRAPHAEKAKYSLLGYRNGSYMGSCAAEVLKRAKVLPKITTVFETSTSNLLRSMALTGLGTAVLQESLIEDDLRDGFLVPAFKTPAHVDCSVLILRSPQPLSAKAEALWQAAKQ